MSDMHTFKFKIVTETKFAKEVAAYLYKMYLIGRSQGDPPEVFQSAWYEIADAFREAGIDIDAIHEELRKEQLEASLE